MKDKTEFSDESEALKSGKVGDTACAKDSIAPAISEEELLAIESFLLPQVLELMAKR